MCKVKFKLFKQIVMGSFDWTAVCVVWFLLNLTYRSIPRGYFSIFILCAESIRGGEPCLICNQGVVALHEHHSVLDCVQS